MMGNVRWTDCGCVIPDVWHVIPGMNEDVYQISEKAKSDLPVFVAFIATDAYWSAST